jgi:carbon-monoxide dehydrogenase small subunit
MTRVACTVNGVPVAFEAEDRTLLVYALRDHLKLCGTNIGCDTSQCGACTVDIDGRSVKSCTVLVGQINGSAIITIEGLSSGEELHPMQQAFRDHHGLQCGYCTSGMIMQALEIVRRFGTELDEQTIREELDGNICRCTGYHNIVLAIQAGARAMRSADAR